jgi:hypothetical protein
VPHSSTYFTTLTQSPLLVLNIIFFLVIVFFAFTKPEQSEILYTRGARGVQPTVQVIIPATLSPLPTPEIPTPDSLPIATESPPLPPPPPPPVEQPAPVIVQEAPQQEQQPEEAVMPIQEDPTPAFEAPTFTPLPAPGEPGFVASFKDDLECSPFIGYIGPKRTYCQAIFTAQTAGAQP